MSDNNQNNSVPYTTDETIMMVDPQNGIVLMCDGLYKALNLITGEGQRVFVNIQTGEYKLVEFMGQIDENENKSESQ